MRRNVAFVFSLLCAVMLFGLTATAQNPYRVNDNQLQKVFTRLDVHTNDYRSSLTAALNRSQYNSTNTETDISSFVRNFQQTTSQLQDRFRNRRSVSSDVEEVLSRGWQIDNFTRTNWLGTDAERNWRLVRTDLQTLAGYYNVSWRWDDRAYNPARNPIGPDNRYGNDNRYGRNRYSSGLTGTYRLNPARSDHVQRAAERVTRGLNQ